MKTAFVTGGTGFLGVNLVQQLIDKKVQIVVFDLSPSKAEIFKHSKVHLIEGDITDRQACDLAMPESVDAVFHLAGNTSHWKYGDDLQTRINVTGTRNIVEAALKKTPNKPIPSFVLKTIGHLSSLLSGITGKEPDVTAEKALLICSDLVCTSDKAIKELEFSPVPLKTMLEDCHTWLVKEKRI